MYAADIPEHYTPMGYEHYTPIDYGDNKTVGANAGALTGGFSLGGLLNGLSTVGSALSGIGAIYIPLDDKVSRPYQNTSEDDADVTDIDWNPDAGENLNDVDVTGPTDGWSKVNGADGSSDIYDNKGNVRLRFDPAKNGANEHWHYYDSSGNPLDVNGNPTYKGAPNSHIYR